MNEGQVRASLASLIGATVSARKGHHHIARTRAVEMAKEAEARDAAIAALPAAQRAAFARRPSTAPYRNGTPLTPAQVSAAAACCGADLVEIDSHAPQPIGTDEILLGEPWIDPDTGARRWDSVTVADFLKMFGAVPTLTHALLVAEDAVIRKPDGTPDPAAAGQTKGYRRFFDEWKAKGLIT